jgi:hypothetical protein
VNIPGRVNVGYSIARVVEISWRYPDGYARLTFAVGCAGKARVPPDARLGLGSGMLSTGFARWRVRREDIVDSLESAAASVAEDVADPISATLGVASLWARLSTQGVQRIPALCGEATARIAEVSTRMYGLVKRLAAP